MGSDGIKFTLTMNRLVSMNADQNKNPSFAKGGIFSSKWSERWDLNP